MFSSLRSRLWLSYLLLILVILSVIAVSLFIYLLRNPILYNQAEQRLKIAVSAITLRMDVLEFASQERLQRVIVREDDLLKVRVMLLDANGAVLADSRAKSAPALPAPPQPFRVQTDTQNQLLTLRDASGAVWLYRLGTIDTDHFVLVALPRPRAAAAIATILRDEFSLLVVRTGAVALLLAILLGVVMARWISAPLQGIAAAARAASLGQYRPLPPQGPREVQDLARAFNEMSHRVQVSQQSQRDFVANVSHELKTPLTSIQGFAQAIQDGTTSSPVDLQQAAGVILGEAGRMYRLVTDLLTLARLDAGTSNLRSEPVDVAALLRAMDARMAPQAAAASVDLRLEISDLPGITADEDRLTQVFTNLVDNAIKFSPAGGEVLLSARQAGSQVEVSVRDAGPGIPPEAAGRIFERFYQTDRSRRGGTGRGSGLGLAIARELVTAQGGTIQVSSAPGQGSEFVVYLPVSRPLSPGLAADTLSQHHPHA